MTIGSLLAWVQTTAIASAIGGSTQLTGLLSGIHLLGLTLLVGAAVVSGLRMMGIILVETPTADVVLWPGRGMIVGLIISVSSGLLLFSPRAVAAAGNSLFQIKILLLSVAVAFHFGVYRRISKRHDARASALKITGGLGLMLWFAVAVAGCAFILFE